MDRFMLKDVLDYPSPAEEAEVLRPDRLRHLRRQHPKPVVAIADVKRLQAPGRARLRRPGDRQLHRRHRLRHAPPATTTSSPDLAALRRLRRQPARRASPSRARPGARALIDGRNHVVPDDVKALTHRVLRHRVILGLRGGRRRRARRERHRRAWSAGSARPDGRGRGRDMTTTLLTRVKSKLFVHARRTLAQPARGGVRVGLPRSQPRLRRPARLRARRRGARHRLESDRPAHLARSSSATSRPASRTSCSSSTPGAAWPPRPAAASRRRRSPSPRPGSSGYLAQRHGDLVGLVRRRRDRSTVAHDLRGIEAPPRAAAARHRRSDDPGRRAEQPRDAAALDRAQRPPPPLLLVVADDEELDPGSRRAVLRRLHVQHEILWITVEDADPTAVDAATGRPRRRRHLHPADAGAPRPPRARGLRRVGRGTACGATDALLDRRGINHARLGSSDEVLAAVFALLERQRRARR